MAVGPTHTCVLCGKDMSLQTGMPLWFYFRRLFRSRRRLSARLRGLSKRLNLWPLTRGYA